MRPVPAPRPLSRIDAKIIYDLVSLISTAHMSATVSFANLSVLASGSGAQVGVSSSRKLKTKQTQRDPRKPSFFFCTPRFGLIFWYIGSRVAARIRRHGAGAQQRGGHGGRRPAATAAGVCCRGEQGVAGTADSAAEPDATEADGHASGQGQGAVLLARRLLRRRHRRHGRRVRAKTPIDSYTLWEMS
jgi:hypothetical protein